LSSINDHGRQTPNALETDGNAPNSLKPGEPLLHYLQRVKDSLLCHGLALQQNLTKREVAFKMLEHVTPQ
jgi:hypothetical protein